MIDMYSQYYYTTHTVGATGSQSALGIR